MIVIPRHIPPTKSPIRKIWIIIVPSTPVSLNIGVPIPQWALSRPVTGLSTTKAITLPDIGPCIGSHMHAPVIPGPLLRLGPTFLLTLRILMSRFAARKALIFGFVAILSEVTQVPTLVASFLDRVDHAVHCLMTEAVAGKALPVNVGIILGSVRTFGAFVTWLAAVEADLFF